MLGGEVVTLGRVVLGVEQLPALGRVVGPHVGGADGVTDTAFQPVG